MLAVRALPSLRLTVNVTVPAPVPLAPDVTAIHEGAFAAVQAQPAGADTATVFPDPPDAGAE
jgi:hypothetical protein